VVLFFISFCLFSFFNLWICIYLFLSFFFYFSFSAYTSGSLRSFSFYLVSDFSFIYMFLSNISFRLSPQYCEDLYSYRSLTFYLCFFPFCLFFSTFTPLSIPLLLNTISLFSFPSFICLILFLLAEKCIMKNRNS
jgi:hypothetical protein